MAEAIQDETGVKAELVGGSGGIFDVEVDGKMVFSKHKVGRFPESFEVLSQIKPK